MKYFKRRNLHLKNKIEIILKNIGKGGFDRRLPKTCNFIEK